jgi:hypothetical protein
MEVGERREDEKWLLRLAETSEIYYRRTNVSEKPTWRHEFPF